MLHFINNLLDAASMQSNHLVPEVVPLNLKDFFENHQAKFQEVVAHKELELHVQIDDNMPATIDTDADWLNKIVSNLINNAIKFTEQGRLSISVTKAGDEHWQLSVQDTGVGIPETALDRILEPFWQVDGSSTRQANRGVGLGLAIVNRFVKLLGGSLKIDSTVGEGTTFTVTFPLTISEKSHA